MSQKDSSYLTYLLEEIFKDIPITSKRMFSGLSLYKDGVIFGMIMRDTLYFKVGETNKDNFEKYQRQPFTYQSTKRGKTITTSYYTVPEEILENKEELKKWINKATAVSKKR